MPSATINEDDQLRCWEEVWVARKTSIVKSPSPDPGAHQRAPKSPLRALVAFGANEPHLLQARTSRSKNTLGHWGYGL